jgi:acetyltransferase
MTIRNLDSLLKPKSVALIGASGKPGSIGLITARNLQQGGFQGPVWFVNPKHRLIEGQPCYPTIADLPGVPDLAVLATPPATIPPLISELGQRGTRAAVVITAGVRDDLKRAMLEAARPSLLRIQGPNCVGLMVPSLGLNASFSHQPPLTGELAFLSQSGALITATIDWSRARSVGFSDVVSLGDMADVDVGDLLDYFAGDPRSRAILLYLESVAQAPKFLSAARRAARAKPVIVVKAGRSATGAKAAMSHTGALAGSDAAYEAAFRRAGLLRVRELDDLFSAAEILARHPPITGDRLTILTNGGGAGVLAADHLGDLDGHLATLSAPTMAALDAILPATWSRGNPVDIVGDADPIRYTNALRLLTQEQASDAILIMNCPTALASSTAVAEQIVNAIDQGKALGQPIKPVMANWLGEEASRDARKLFAAKGIASFATPAEAIDGFMQLVRYARAQNELMRTPPSLPEDLGLDTQTAGAIIAGVIGAGRTALSEVEGKQLLAAYGIPTVATEVATDPAGVGAMAAPLIARYGACVVKILSDDILHKSDVGGVRLGLEHAEEAERAASDILARAKRLVPNARIKGFTVQPMIQRTDAHELILGMSVDQTFGPLLMFGAGGTAVEAIHDTAHALPPLDLNLAQDLMRQTRIWRLLQGYRQCPPAAIEQIAAALVRLSYLVSRHPEIREVDVNPLLADENGVIALDARVTVADNAITPRVAPAIRPYPSQWTIETTVEPAGPVRIRPIAPQDEALYAAFLAQLSAGDRRLRFFTAAPDLSHRFLARLTQIDYAREMAFVAIARDTGALLGVARFVADPDYTAGEFAILVRSDLKGHGLGWKLMQHLIAYARAEGLQQLYGSVLVGNTVMLEMCRELTFSIAPDPGDAQVRHVVLQLK